MRNIIEMKRNLLLKYTPMGESIRIGSITLRSRVIYSRGFYICII